MPSAKHLLQFNFNADAFSRRVPGSLPETETMQLLEAIEQRHDYRLMTKNRENLRESYRLFVQADDNCSLKQAFDTSWRVRQLAWALTYVEDRPPFDRRIVDSPRLQEALSLIENRFRISRSNTQGSRILHHFVVLFRNQLPVDGPGENRLKVFVFP